MLDIDFSSTVCSMAFRLSSSVVLFVFKASCMIGMFLLLQLSHILLWINASVQMMAENILHMYIHFFKNGAAWEGNVELLCRGTY